MVIGSCRQTVRNASGVAGDSCIWNELPERVLTSSIDDCRQVHRVTFLEIQACLVFTDASSKTVKSFLDRNVVQGLAGIGIQGQTEGSKAEL